MGELLGIPDVRDRGAEVDRLVGRLPLVGASPVSAIATLLLGVATGGMGLLAYAARMASRNNELMLEAAARQASGELGGPDVSGAMAVSATMLAPFAFMFGTPLGWLATYLTLTGLVRSVAAAVGEPRRDPLVAFAVRATASAARRRRESAEDREREALEGPEVADRVVLPARLGISGADLVLVASRRKPDWTPGTVLDCDGRWFRVGLPMERSLAVGLRTLYPLSETKEAEVFRRIVPYVLPPVPPPD